MQRTNKSKRMAFIWFSQHIRGGYAVAVIGGSQNKKPYPRSANDVLHPKSDPEFNFSWEIIINRFDVIASHLLTINRLLICYLFHRMTAKFYSRLFCHK
jgi:hypothetical protein